MLFGCSHDLDQEPTQQRAQAGVGVVARPLLRGLDSAWSISAEDVARPGSHQVWDALSVQDALKFTVPLDVRDAVEIAGRPISTSSASWQITRSIRSNFCR